MRRAAASSQHVIPEPLSVRDEASGCGPRSALGRLDLKSMSSDERNSWLEGARADAILGSCKRSLPFVRSGLRCYEGFMSKQYLMFCILWCMQMVATWQAMRALSKFIFYRQS